MRVPTYDLMVHQPYSYCIRVLIHYVLKPMLIVVLVLIPVLSKERIFVTEIIVVLVQLSQIPTSFRIHRNFAPVVVVLFVLGTISSSVWVWFLVCVFSATFFLFNAYMDGITLIVTNIFAQSAFVAVTVNLSWGFLTASVLFPIWMLLAFFVNRPESILLTSPLIIGLVTNVVFTKFGIIDIMILIMTVAIIQEASTAPLLICAASKYKCIE